MRKRAKAILIAAIAGIYTLLWSMAQVSPANAKANLRQWMPEWLWSPWALATALTVTAGLFAWLFQTEIAGAFRWLGERLGLRLQWPVRRVVHAESVANPMTPALAERDDRVRELEEEVARLKKAALEMRELLVTLNDEKMTFEVQRNEAARNARRAHQLLAYGRELHEMRDAVTEAAQLSVGELAPLLDTMFEAAKAVWHPIAKLASEAGDEAPISHFTRLVGEKEYYFLHRSLQLFWERYNHGTPGDDLRPALRVVCLCYFDWRDQVERITTMLALPLVERDGYVEWQAAEMAFFVELQKKAANVADSTAQAIRARFADRGKTIAVTLPPVSLALPRPAEKPPAPCAKILSVRRAKVTEEQFIAGDMVFLVDTLVSEKTAFGDWVVDLAWPDGTKLTGLPGTIAAHQCDVGRFELTVTANYVGRNTRAISESAVTRLSTVDHHGIEVEFTQPMPVG